MSMPAGIEHEWGRVNNVSVNTLPVWPLQCRTIKLQPTVLVQHHNHTAITHLPSHFKQCSGYARFEAFTKCTLHYNAPSAYKQREAIHCTYTE